MSNKYTDAKKIMSRYGKQDIFFKKVVYELLKSGDIVEQKDIFKKISELHLENVIGLKNKVYKFFVMCRKPNVYNIVKTEVIRRYEKNYSENEKNFQSKLSMMSTPPKVNIDNIEKLPISAVTILKDCRDEFANLDRHISSSKGYLSTVRELLSAHLLPNSPEGMKMIEDNHLDANLLIRYFDLLDRISIGLSISDNRADVRRLLNSLTDNEYDLICDLENENLTLESPEGIQMLEERTSVRKDKIEKIYELRQKVNNEMNRQNLQNVYNSLNDNEKGLVDDLLSENLTLKDSEGIQMLEERTSVRKEKIEKYFELRDKINQDIYDYNAVAVHRNKTDSLSRKTDVPEPTEEREIDNPDERREEVHEADSSYRFAGYKMGDGKLDSMDEELQSMQQKKARDEAKKNNRFFSRVKHFFGASGVKHNDSERTPYSEDDKLDEIGRAR